MRWERNKEEENWVSWRKEQNEDEVERIGRWYVIWCPHRLSQIALVVLCVRLNYDESK